MRAEIPVYLQLAGVPDVATAKIVPGARMLPVVRKQKANKVEQTSYIQILLNM
jgi:hypothetical protein